MAKAQVNLPNGTVVNIEGTPEEIERLLNIYSGAPLGEGQTAKPARSAPKRKKKRVVAAGTEKSPTGSPATDIIGIVNKIRTCEESEAIEKKILDKPSQLNRVLLPMYAVHEFMGNAFGLTSGDVDKVTTQLGVRVATNNASNVLANEAKSYVLGDTVRVKGQPVRYKLHRRGVQYMKEVLAAGAATDATK